MSIFAEKTVYDLQIKSVVLAICLIMSSTTQVVAACSQALLLATDVSSSIDENEYNLQKEGLIQALSDPEVVNLLVRPQNNQVALALFEWSGHGQQNIIQDWVILHSPEQIMGITSRIHAHKRSAGTHPTSIGSAMRFAINMFARAPRCAVWTLDISGDGKNNTGPRPSDFQAKLEKLGITVNALVIGHPDEIAELSAYFSNVVKTGPNAFIEVAFGFADYGRAMKQKLLREVTSAFVGIERPSPISRLGKTIVAHRSDTKR